jgi:hypothetical protein
VARSPFGVSSPRRWSRCSNLCRLTRPLRRSRSNRPSAISGEKYPWDKQPDGTPRGPKDDLAEARHLIYKHGYLRRKEELEDAERALLR